LELRLRFAVYGVIRVWFYHIWSP